jgi:hypothetical protein
MFNVGHLSVVNRWKNSKKSEIYVNKARFGGTLKTIKCNIEEKLLRASGNTQLQAYKV